MTQVDMDAIPGSSGTLRKRVTEVIENEVPHTYARLASQRAGEVVEAWQDEEREAFDRVRQWFALYGPTLSKSAAGDLAAILADAATE